MTIIFETNDFSDLTIQQDIEFYILTQNFKILNLKLWLLWRVEFLFHGVCIFLDSNQVIK